MKTPDEVRNDIRLLRENDYTYFDSATVTLIPDAVIKYISEGYELYNSTPSQGNNTLVRKTKMILDETREKFENFIDAEKNTVFFTPNIMYGITNLIWSIINHKTGTILISPLLHTSILGPLINISKINNNKIKMIPLNNNTIDTEFLTNNIEKDVIAIITDDVSLIYGVEQPTEEIAKIANDYNILHIIDATRSLGHKKFSVREKKVSAAIMAGNIGIMGPSISPIYITPEILKSLQPKIIGGGAIEKISVDKISSLKNITKFEGDYIDIPKIYGLKKALEYIRNIGFLNIENHEKYIIDQIKKILVNNNIKIHSIDSSQNIISFTSSKLAAFDIGMFLDEEEIYVRTGKICTYLAPIFKYVNSVCQISIHYYNTQKDIDRLNEAIENLFKML